MCRTIWAFSVFICKSVRGRRGGGGGEVWWGVSLFVSLAPPSSLLAIWPLALCLCSDSSPSVYICPSQAQPAVSLVQDVSPVAPSNISPRPPRPPRSAILVLASPLTTANINTFQELEPSPRWRWRWRTEALPWTVPHLLTTSHGTPRSTLAKLTGWTPTPDPGTPDLGQARPGPGDLSPGSGVVPWAMLYPASVDPDRTTGPGKLLLPLSNR